MGFRSAARADVVQRAVAATAARNTFFMIVPLPLGRPPKGAGFKKTLRPQVPTAGRLLAFLSRKPNDIPGTCSKANPAANAAFLGVLAVRKSFDLECCKYVTKTRTGAWSRGWNNDRARHPLAEIEGSGLILARRIALEWGDSR